MLHMIALGFLDNVQFVTVKEDFKRIKWNLPSFFRTEEARLHLDNKEKQKISTLNVCASRGGVYTVVLNSIIVVN